jgi:hypothetical protein
MLEYDFKLDVYRALCAAAWLMFFLILKNIILLIVLVIQRRNDYVYKTPKDTKIETIEDWSLAGRISE